MIEVYSDVVRDEKIPNLVHTLWNKSDEYSTWMKITHMMKVWGTPPYKSVDWFVITHDTAYLNLDNLFDYVVHLDASEPMVIGEVQCREDGLQYPDWKASIVFSRGFMDSMVWDYWYAPERSGLRRSRYNSNVFWGEYINSMKEFGVSVKLVNHPGMLSSAYSEGSDLLAAFTSHVGEQWPYPFRPISSDQAEGMGFMPELDDKIKNLPTEVSTTKIYDIPTCNCKEGLSSRCLPDAQAEVKDISCVHSAAQLKCLGCSDCN